MKPEMLKPTMLCTILLGFVITFESFANGNARQTDHQGKLDALQRETKTLLSTVSTAYETNKARILPANDVAAIVFTVATQRYDDTHILIALQINAADATLLAMRPALDMEIQPVALADGQTIEKVGSSATGTFRGVQPGPPGALNAFSYSLTARPEANGVRFTGTLARAEHPVEFDFNVSVGSKAYIVYTGSNVFNIPIADN